MEVVSTEGRGPQTIYTVKEGERVWTISKSELPQDVFHRWRNRQAAICMRRKREQARANTGSDQQNNLESASRQLNLPEQSSDLQRPSTSNETSAISTLGQRAIDIITCKICQDNEVKKMIIPCGHLVFCASCLTKAMSQNNTCPICRTVIRDHFGVIMIE